MLSYEELDNKFCDDDRFMQENVPPEVYQEYLNQVNEVLVEDSDNIDALEMKYFLLFSLEKFDECVETCDIVLKRTPNSIEVLNQKANCLFFLNRYGECIRICQRILEINPKNEDAILMWGSAHSIANDNTLPKPPMTLEEKLWGIFALVIILIIVVFVTYFSIKFLV